MEAIISVSILDPEAKSVVERMMLAYASCSTYRDTGQLVQHPFNIVFKTFFARPNRLYFEYRSEYPFASEVADLVPSGFIDSHLLEGPRGSFWTTGPRTMIRDALPNGEFREIESIPTSTWHSIREVSQAQTSSLESAIARFYGISASTSGVVVRYLFPNCLVGPTYAQMEDFKYEGVEEDGGVMCDLITSDKHQVKAWLDRETHLLRKEMHRHRQENPWFPIEIKPEVNVHIDDSELVFQGI